MSYKLLRRALYILFFAGLSVLAYNYQDPVFRSNFDSVLTLSRGDRYYNRLQTWFKLAKEGDWSNAHKLEGQLDLVHITSYKSAHDPDELKKLINSLTVKSNKNVEDWLELARVQSLVGKNEDALKSVSKAREIDPVREDITRLYYQLSK